MFSNRQNKKSIRIRIKFSLNTNQGKELIIFVYRIPKLHEIFDAVDGNRNPMHIPWIVLISTWYAQF